MRLPRPVLLCLLLSCAHPTTRAVVWPAPAPADGCFAGALPDADLPGPEAGLSVQPPGIGEEAVLRVVRGRLKDAKPCFSAAMAGRPGLSGRVQLRLQVGAGGTVTRAEIERTTLHYPELEACLARSTCRWRFPAPTTGGPVTVTYPWTLFAR